MTAKISKIAAVVQKEPATITFTEEDFERLSEVVDFLLGMRSVFDIREYGHKVDKQAIAELMAPAVTRANDFWMEISGRFNGAR
jgi:hypothetical protein